MLRRANRFHGYNSLNDVYRNGSTVRANELSIRYKVNPKRNQYRVAVVVSKKVSKSAVVRNRIRRRVFEIMRQQGDAIHQPFDIVISIHSENIADMPTLILKDILLGQLSRAKITARSHVTD